MYFSLRLFTSICCIFPGKCYHFITSFFPSERNVDPQRVLQIKEENSLIGNKRRTRKLHCLLISHRAPKAVCSITDAANSPCPASSFFCTLFLSPAVGVLFAPPGWGLALFPPVVLLFCRPHAHGRLYSPQEVHGWMGWKVGCGWGERERQ